MCFLHPRRDFISRQYSQAPVDLARSTTAPGSAALVQALLLEDQVITLHFRNHAITGREFAAQDLLRQRILDLGLNRALQGPRAVDGVEPRLPDAIARGVVEPQLDVALRETMTQPAELNIDDGADLLAPERVEHHDLVDSIDELGPEMLCEHLHHRALHRGVVRLTAQLL